MLSAVLHAAGCALVWACGRSSEGNRACELRMRIARIAGDHTAGNHGELRGGSGGNQGNSPRFSRFSLQFTHAIRICDSGGSRDSVRVIHVIRPRNTGAARRRRRYRQPSRRARGSLHEIHQSRARRVPVNETVHSTVPLVVEEPVSVLTTCTVSPAESG